MGGQKFLLFFNATGLLKNWKKQHFICSNLTLFIVPFFLFSLFFSFFFLFFSFFLSFFLFFFFLGEATAPQPPLNDASDHAYTHYNARYTSHRIQNKLIQICGDQIRDDKLAECRNAPYFSLIVDETTDISVKEQVSFVLLYLDKNGKRLEEFVGFEETADTTGQTLYDLICKKLLEWNLDKEKVVGLGFDGAANMSGKFKSASKICQ